MTGWDPLHRAEHAWLDHAQALYAQTGVSLRETPVHYYLDGMRTGGSIHKDDLFVLRRILTGVDVETAFVVGAAFGFSSLFLASVLRGATVLSLDNWSEGTDGRRAGAICASLAALDDDACRRLRFATGHSPQDTGSSLEAAAMGQVDLAFIDGLHTNAQTMLDLEGVWPRLHHGSLVLLHDVRLFRLHEALGWLVGQSAFDTVVMLNTAPGTVIAFNREVHPTAFRALQEPGMVAHWRPELSTPESTTMRFPALGWSPDDDTREQRHHETPRPATRWPVRRTA